MKTILKNLVWAALFAFVSVAMFSCSAEDEFTSATATGKTRTAITVSGVITGTNNWSGTVYLDGKVFVVNGTLNIAAGTEIIGKAKSTAEAASALIVTRTGTINAIGSASSPIVFKGESETKGSWGGLVVLGDGIINQKTRQAIEGITTAQAGGNDVTYGIPYDSLTVGSTAYNNALNDNSGTLSYVRVEYAGASIATDNELNSFTFGGVGAGTTLNHLQAYYGADDAFEWFGGNVNAKYLLAVGADDDSFDFDFGYSGNLQFLVSVIDPAQSYSANPNGIESDNDASGHTDYLPNTHPVISNITIAGTSTGNVAGGAVGSSHALLYAAHLRRYSGATIVNGIFYGFPSGIVNNGGNTSGITLLTNVGTATTSANTYVGFSSLASSNVTVTNATSLVLTSPFGTFESGTSYKLGGLTPSGSPATGPAYNANTNLGSFFDVPSKRGGANDKSSTNGANWLAEAWVR
jgi:hypothetical protein